jgi:hypothetical protein
MRIITAAVTTATVFALSIPALAQRTPEEAQLLENYRRASPAQKQKVQRGLAPKVRSGGGGEAVAAVDPVPLATPVALNQNPPVRETLLNKHTPAVELARREAARAGVAPLAAAPVEPPREVSPCAGFNLLLRADWKDIGLLSCPVSTEKAAGAEISYTGDRVAKNNVFTARGTAAFYYTSVVDGPGVFDRSIGAYLTINRVINSAPAAVKGDSDKIAFGGTAEIGIEHERGANFFRVRGGVVEDRLKNTSSANVTAEWVPVYSDRKNGIFIHRPFPVFGGAMILRFDPVLLAQYAAVTGKNQVLDFNDQAHAFRVGPQFTLRILPGLVESEFWSRLSGEVTYHWAYETYSSRGISWFQSSVTYNIDDAGQFGITGSYRKGRDEDTGTLTDIYKIALTGKI